LRSGRTTIEPRRRGEKQNQNGTAKACPELVEGTPGTQEMLLLLRQKSVKGINPFKPLK
jgi:hypothetical protein